MTCTQEATENKPADGLTVTNAMVYALYGAQNGRPINRDEFEGFRVGIRAALLAAPAAVHDAFQARVQPWMMECFGAEIASDRIERNHRFFEEATELVQANGMTRSEAHQLVDYTFDRPVGELHQEIGGVMVTLAALCLASHEDMHAAGEIELARIWTKVEKIRAKQAAKPKHSPLPESPSPASESGDARDAARFLGIMDTLVAVMNEQKLTPVQERMHGMLDAIEVGTITIDHVRTAIDAAMKPDAVNTAAIAAEGAENVERDGQDQ